MTVSEFIAYVRNMHNAQSDDHWSDLEIIKLLQAKANEAMATIGLIEATTTDTSVADQADYDYPENAVRIFRIRYDGDGLKVITQRQYDDLVQPGGTIQTGRPQYYYLWNNVITLVPTPDTSGYDIDILYEKQQSTLSDTTGTIDLPAIFHSALADGVIYMMYAKDENLSAANFFRDIWLNVHIPAMRRYRRARRRTGQFITVADSDTLIDTEFGIS